MPSDNELDEKWRACAALKPMLRSHIRITAQRYRGQRWYVLHDQLTGRNARINPLAYDFVARLDGCKPVQQVVQEMNTTGETQFSRTSAISLLRQLQRHGGILSGLCSVRDASARQLQELTQQRPSSLLRKLLSPLAIRIPLLDPDSFLDRVGRHVFPFYGLAACVVLCGVVLLAVVAAAFHWGQLQSEFVGIAESPHYWLMMWLVYPLLKIFHEFSHAIMVKRGGGEVHEMGITLLVFTPVPYVDASSAWSFRSRMQRVMVSAAGIMVELLMASFALFFWILSESGLLHDVAFAMLLVGSFSTIVFNANPLLKFDGYYILQDLLEIPNLYQRAQQYLLFLVKRHVLRVGVAQAPPMSRGEPFWFVLFGICALLYRNLVMLLIAVWLLDKLLLVGVVILAWVVIQQYLAPFYRLIRYLASSPELADCRLQRTASLAVVMLCILLLLTQVPVSHSSRVQGVVWVSDQAQLYAGQSGEVIDVFAQPGQSVEKGDVILQLAQPELATRIAVLRSQLSALRIRRQAEAADLALRSDLSTDDIAATQAALALALVQHESLLVRAQATGTLVWAESGRLTGRYFQQGDLIGHIVDPSQMVIRVVIPERNIGAINSGIASASVRLAERIEHPVTAFLSQQTPSANNRLPSAALGSAAGGGIAIAAGDQSGMRTRERVFHLELSPAEPLQVAGLGERAFVSLQHASTPLADRFLTTTRQLFLKHLPDYAG